MIDVGIVGVGTYLPEKTMKAAEIAGLTNGVWSEDAVINKLGIKQRYLPGPDDGTQEMGAKAALKCLENTGVDPKEIDVILCIGEEWKEYPLTTSACYIQDRIGATNAWGIDVQNRCCTCVSAMKIAADMLRADDEINTIMICGGYRNGDFVDFTDKNMSMMYNLSAGGGAIILKKNYGKNLLLGSKIMSDGSLARTAGVEIGGIAHPFTKDNIEEQRNINIQTNPDQPEVIFAQINSTTATELASQVQLVKDCDVVIIAGNQTYFQAAYTAMQTADVRKPVITSYVNIAPATVPDEAVDANASDIYGGAWVIIDDSADERQKADLLRFIAICDWGVEKGIISRSTADSYLISAYAMSSFIALDVFMTGIDRLADKEITREAFLEAMESAPINVPISGGVNYANGQRIGLDGMSFVKYVRPTEAGAAASTGTFVNVVGMQSIDQILGELDDAE